MYVFINTKKRAKYERKEQQVTDSHLQTAMEHRKDLKAQKYCGFHNMKLEAVFILIAEDSIKYHYAIFKIMVHIFNAINRGDQGKSGNPILAPSI